MSEDRIIRLQKEWELSIYIFKKYLNKQSKEQLIGIVEGMILSGKIQVKE